MKNRVCRSRKGILKAGEEDGGEMEKMKTREMRIVRIWRKKIKRKGGRRKENVERCEIGETIN